MVLTEAQILEKLFAPLNEGKLTITPLETKYDVTPVSNSLSIALGDERKAKLFKQLWFWCTHEANGVVIDGKRWVWKSANDFRKEIMPTWKVSTVNKLLKELAELGVIHREMKWKEHFGNTNDPRNRTYYYAINLPKTKELFVDAVKKFSPDFLEPTPEVDSQLENASKPYAPSFANSANLDLRVSANHSKEYNQLKHLEKTNIETQIIKKETSNLQLEENLNTTLVNTRNLSIDKSDQNSQYQQSISLSLVRKNLKKGINDRDQRDLSKLKKNNKEKGGGATLRKSKEIDQNSDCVLIESLEEAEVSPKIEQPTLRGDRRSDKHRQPHRNGANTNDNLENREMYQNFNNPGGIAPGDDPNDPELIGRRYNAMKAVYSSKASDPWMETRSKLNEGFLEWLKRRKRTEGQEISLVNLKAEIRNNYERAQDYWDDYRDVQDKRTKEVPFGYPQHRVTMESLDEAQRKQRERAAQWLAREKVAEEEAAQEEAAQEEESNSRGESEIEGIDYKAKLEKESRLLSELEEANQAAEQSRIDYHNREELEFIESKERERLLLLKKLSDVPLLKMRFPTMKDRLEENAIEYQAAIQGLTNLINELKRKLE